MQQGLEPFRSTIEAVQRLLSKFDNRGVIIGGIAVGFLGKPRFTEDVDAMFLLSTGDISKLLDEAKTEEIQPRIPDAENFARKSRVLLLKHIPTNINIDISLGILPFEEEMVDRGSIQSTATLSVRLPTPEDLIIMKAIAHRPKDLEDIRSIIDKHPALDNHRIKQWVKSFADILETPSLWTDIEGMFK